MIASATTEAQILSEVIGPDRGDMPAEIARSIVGLRFSDTQNARMRELADRNNRGVLTDAESAEMESYRRVGNFLALLQAKARLSLSRNAEHKS